MTRLTMSYELQVGSIKGHDGTWPGLIDFCGSCAWKGALMEIEFSHLLLLLSGW